MTRPLTLRHLYIALGALLTLFALMQAYVLTVSGELIYLTLLFAVVLAIFSVVHQHNRRLEVACLVSSFMFCSYFIIDQYLPEPTQELVRVLTIADGVWFYLMWLARAPRIAIGCVGLNFAGGVLLLIFPNLVPLTVSSPIFLGLHLLLVFTLTLAPFVRNLKTQ